MKTIESGKKGNCYRFAHSAEALRTKAPRANRRVPQGLVHTSRIGKYKYVHLVLQEQINKKMATPNIDNFSPEECSYTDLVCVCAYSEWLRGHQK